MRRKDSHAYHLRRSRSRSLAAATLSAQTPTVIAPPPDVAAAPATMPGKDALGPGVQGAEARDRARPIPAERLSPCTTRLDDRRQDVRQLGRARQAGGFPVHRVIRRWTEGCSSWSPARTAPLDSRGARLQGQRGSRRACSSSTSSSSRHRQPARAGRRQGAARRREEDGQRPRLQGAQAGHRQAPTRSRAAR